MEQIKQTQTSANFKIIDDEKNTPTLKGSAGTCRWLWLSV